MGPWIWFNLILFVQGHWVYIDSFTTLEECQAAAVELEQDKEFKQLGILYCLPANVVKS